MSEGLAMSGDGVFLLCLGFLLVFAFVFAVITTEAHNACQARNDLWAAWEELGRKEALAGQGAQNRPTGLAGQAYVQGWRQVIVEWAVKEANTTQ